MFFHEDIYIDDTALFAIKATVVAFALASEAVPPQINGARAITIRVINDCASARENLE